MSEIDAQAVVLLKEIRDQIIVLRHELKALSVELPPAEVRTVLEMGGAGINCPACKEKRQHTPDDWKNHPR